MIFYLFKCPIIAILCNLNNFPIIFTQFDSFFATKFNNDANHLVNSSFTLHDDINFNIQEY